MALAACFALTAAFVSSETIPSPAAVIRTQHPCHQSRQLTFSSKAVRVGSSCSLESKGVTDYSMGEKGVEERGVLQLGDHLGHLRRHSLGAPSPSLMWEWQRKHQPKPHQALYTAGNPGHKAPLWKTHGQQQEGAAWLSGQQLCLCAPPAHSTFYQSDCCPRHPPQAQGAHG